MPRRCMSPSPTGTRHSRGAGILGFWKAVNPTIAPEFQFPSFPLGPVLELQPGTWPSGAACLSPVAAPFGPPLTPARPTWPPERPAGPRARHGHSAVRGQSGAPPAVRGKCVRQAFRHPESGRSVGWQLCRGIGGSLRVESVAGLPWNGWQLCYGISGRLRAEYAWGYGECPTRGAFWGDWGTFQCGFHRREVGRSVPESDDPVPKLIIGRSQVQVLLGPPSFDRNHIVAAMESVRLGRVSGRFS